MYKQLLLICAVTLAAVQARARNQDTNRYFLYTRPNTADFDELSPTDLEMEIDSKKTVILVHGHDQNHFTIDPAVKNALLKNEDINVIVLDWSTYTIQSYDNADRQVPVVGSNLADFLNILILNDILPNQIHLVGHGLGAYVVSSAAKVINKIARITALDPTKTKQNHKIELSDATYTEVIHTDKDGIFSNGIGGKIGHADFYPNGGGNQPGCFGSSSCNHKRAWELFAASFQEKNKFLARCCDSMRQMNLNKCRGTDLAMGNNKLRKEPCPPGIYRVNTGSRYPF